MLQENPKGILWLTDEITSLMLNLDKYSKNNSGGTKARLLSAHSCGPWKTNRASNAERNFYIRKACVGICGGIQPGMLRRVFQGGSGGVDEESGFLPRFLFIRAVATAPALYSEQSISTQGEQTLERIANTLWNWDIEYDATGNEIEQYILVTDDAKKIYKAWYDTIAKKAYISTDSARLKKVQAHALRICLLLHCLDAVLSGTDGLYPVIEDTMRRALMLADWVQEHQNQCWALLMPNGKAKQADPMEMAIIQAIIELADTIKINGWKILNAKLFPLVKVKLGNDHVSDIEIGKAASRLGLLPYKSGDDRGRNVSAETIETFRATVQPVPSVPTLTVAMDSSQGSTIGALSVSVPDYGFSDNFITSCLQAGIITTKPLSEVIAAIPDNILQEMNAMRDEVWQGFY